MQDGIGGRGAAPRAFRSSRDLGDAQRAGTATWMRTLQTLVDRVNDARSDPELGVYLTDLMYVTELWRNEVYKRELAHVELSKKSKEARFGKVLPRA